MLCQMEIAITFIIRLIILTSSNFRIGQNVYEEKQSRKYMPTGKYRVYVIELSKKVFTENRKFREANPQFNGVLECLYVGMTSKDVYERFEEHITGSRSRRGHKLSSNIVRRYGRYLRGSLFNHLPLMNREEALEAERDLALKLRRQRYAVWFG